MRNLDKRGQTYFIQPIELADLPFNRALYVCICFTSTIAIMNVFWKPCTFRMAGLWIAAWIGWGGMAQQIRFSEDIPFSYQAHRVERVGVWDAHYYVVRSNFWRTSHEVDLISRRTLRRIRSFEIAWPSKILDFRPVDSVLRVWGVEIAEGKEWLVVGTYDLKGHLQDQDTLWQHEYVSWGLRSNYRIAPLPDPQEDAVFVTFPARLRKGDTLHIGIFSNRTLQWQGKNAWEWSQAGSFDLQAYRDDVIVGRFLQSRIVQRSQPYLTYIRIPQSPILVPLFSDSFRMVQGKPTWPWRPDYSAGVGWLAENDLFPSRRIGYGWIPIGDKHYLPHSVFFYRWPDELVTAIEGADAKRNYLENVSLLQLLSRKDGGAIFLMEINYKRTEVFQQTSAFGHVQTNRRTYYFSDEVILFPVDSVGKMQWFRVLLKHQASQEDDALFTSVGYMVQSQRVIILFNNMHQRYWNSEVWEVDVWGHTHRQILFTQKERPLDVSWRVGRQIDYTTFVAPAYFQRGDKYCLVELVFPIDRSTR